MEETFLRVNALTNYSKTPLYQASWGKGKMRGKLRGTINRGTVCINSNIKLVFSRKDSRRGKPRDPVNQGMVNQSFTIVQWTYLASEF